MECFPRHLMEVRGDADCTATVEHGILHGRSCPQARMLHFPQEGLPQRMLMLLGSFVFLQSDGAVVESETKKLCALEQKKAPNKPRALS